MNLQPNDQPLEAVPAFQDLDSDEEDMDEEELFQQRFRLPIPLQVLKEYQASRGGGVHVSRAYSRKLLDAPIHSFWKQK